MMKKGLSLIEVLVATAIFSALSVVLYSFLRTGISVRDKIEQQEGKFQDICLHLERVAQELRNLVFFKPDASGFKGDSGQLEFYTVSYNYSEKAPEVLQVSYQFKNGVWEKTMKAPLTEEVLKKFKLMENIETVKFSYYNKDTKDDTWQDEWKDEKKIPQGVKIEMAYKEQKGNSSGNKKILDKFVYLYRKEEF